MKTTAILIMILALAINSITGYHLGGDDVICWKTDMITKERVQMDACPEGLNVEYLTVPDDDMRESKEYSAKLKLSVPTDGSIVVSKSTLKDGTQVDIPHVNIHSCLSHVGFCTPFVKNTPGLSTHSKALSSDFTNGEALFETTFTLNKGSYVMIAHGRVFADGGNTKYDLAAAVWRTVLPHTVNRTVSEDAKTFMLALVILTIAIQVAALGFIGVYRKHIVVRYSQPSFLVGVIFCAIVGTVGTLFLGYFDVSAATCGIRNWVTFVPLTMMLCILLAKTHRIYKLLGNKALRKVKATAAGTWTKALVLTSIMVAIMLANAFVNNPAPFQLFAHLDLINYSMVCSGSDDTTYTTIAFVYMAVLLLAGAYMAKKTSNFTVLFNESESLAFSIQNLALLAFVLLPIEFAVSGNPTAVYILRTLGVVASVNMTVLSLLIPKYLLIKSGVEFTKAGDTARTTVKTNAKTTNMSVRTHHRTSSVSAKINNGALSHDVLEQFEDLAELTEKVTRKQHAGIAVTKEEMDKVASASASLAKALMNAKYSGKALSPSRSAEMVDLETGRKVEAA